MALPYKAIPRKLADGTVKRYYYHKVTRRAIDSEPGAKDWAEKLAAAGHQDGVCPPGSVGWLISEFRRSQKWAGLAAATRDNYARGWRPLDRVAMAPVRDIKRRHLIAIYDEILPRIGMANQFLSAVQVLMKFAVRKDLIEANPAADIEREAGGHWAEWDERFIATFRENMSKTTPQMRMAFLLGLYTGMRASDVCSLTWRQYDGAYIRFTQAKTMKKDGQELRIPVHPELKVALDEATRTTSRIYVVPAQQGGKQNPLGLRKAWQRATAVVWAVLAAGDGGRKACVISLAHLGATPHEIASVTGHSLAMVSLYTRGVNRASLAEKAMAKYAGRKNVG
jgi:integrase